MQPHSMETLAFHSLLRWKLILTPILTHHLYIFLLKEVLFEFGSEKIERF